MPRVAREQVKLSYMRPRTYLTTKTLLPQASQQAQRCFSTTMYQSLVHVYRRSSLPTKDGGSGPAAHHLETGPQRLHLARWGIPARTFCRIPVFMWPPLSFGGSFCGCPDKKGPILVYVMWPLILGNSRVVLLAPMFGDLALLGLRMVEP